MKRNPLVRAIRPDKLTLAALNGTLRLFLDPDRLPQTHPIYAMLTEPIAAVNRRAGRLARELKAAAGDGGAASVEDGLTEVGSGALPARGIPTRVVALTIGGFSAEKLARRLRLATPPVFTRIEEGRVVLDARTIAGDEIPMVIRAVGKCKG
jgi:L-seryl-tRNA(Ser) seleniumtransferase